MSKIFVVVGKSATGKDTIFKALRENGQLNLKSVVTYTTRPIREGETEGMEYFFVSRERLQQLQESNKVIEHRAYKTVHGIWDYFTVDDGQIDLNTSNYILIGTLESFEQIRNYYGEKAVIPLYIQVEDGIRLERALHREKQQKSPKYAELCRRYLADEKDFSEKNLKKLGICKRYENHDFDQCLSEIIRDMGENLSVDEKVD